MKLVKARIRGTGKLRESHWFEVSPQLNLFQFPGDKGLDHGRNFLHILQTINPTYAVRTHQPFAALPSSIEQNGYIRRIHPAKRTVALAVFNATPQLVKELSAIGDWFYETDRIEVGRRFDYSRWINFVELASSTRWSEISADIEYLLAQANRISPASTIAPSDIDSLRPSDRVIGQLQENMRQWLHGLPPELLQNSRQLIEKTDTAVMRATHFQTARNIVRTRLPLFVVLGTDPELLSMSHLLQLISQKVHAADETTPGAAQNFINTLNEQLLTLQFSGLSPQLEQTFAGVMLKKDNKAGESRSPLRHMQIKTALAIAYSRIACQSEPILLLAGPEQHLPSSLHTELADFIMNISNTCQCLYSSRNFDIFPADTGQRRYNGAEDSLVPMPMDEPR